MTLPGLAALVGFHYLTLLGNVMAFEDDCDPLLRELVPNAQANDAVYLYSRTAADRFAQSQTRYTALENDILQGRKPVSAWGVEADAWWRRCGQQMSQELAQAYVDAGRG